ncbi:DUF4404 family protein [Methylogaea oryzae]|uniref:DUF4404 family protein n=1 Tax=Methylogaea oryzae TaxID=1295382 RepID=A0A8D4VQW4_9GAMM|nr:DUF4404 family protein [Methylogaea oryzae]BBL72440.1 hypothetical protein MoryE10_30460 [Methylogaea oryzae]
MSQQKLNDVIHELKNQIASLEVSDAQAKQKLQSLVEGLEEKLRSPADAGHHHGLVEEVRDSVEHFEVEHPRITAILNDLMMTLSNMGI